MIAELVAAVVDALAAEGLRVAVRAADVTPPVVYLQLGHTSDAGASLAGGLLVTLDLYYIPIRGIDNPEAEADALDALYRAVRPMAMAELATDRASVTLANETWPGHRAALTALALDPVEVR